MKIKCSRQENKQAHPSRRKGMTLVEVVVALFITTLSIAGIINGYNYCTNSAQKSALNLAANAFAMQRIEEIRSATWDMTTSTVVDQLDATNFLNKVVKLDMSGSGTTTTPATIQTEITQISTTPPLKRIRVSCVWRFKGAQWVTNTIETCRGPTQ